MQGPRATVIADRVQLTQAERTQAALSPNPRLYLQTEDLRPWDNNFTFPNDTEDYAYLSQTFEVDGKRGKRVALADANLHVSEAQQAMQLRGIAGEVGTAYWTAVADQQIVQALQEDLSAVEAMVTYHRQRVDAGAMRGVDLIRMEMERDRVLLNLQGAERDAELAQTELCRQMGVLATHPLRLTGDLRAVEVLPDIDILTAAEERPEVIVAKDQIAAARADLKLQHANAVPDPDLLGGYKRDVGTNTAYAALQLPLPFRNRNQGEVARAQAQLQAAQNRLKEVQISVQLEIQAASQSYRKELAIMQNTLPPMRARAQQNLQIESEAYRLGGVDLLRYLDAERSGYEVEVTAIHALAAFHQAELRLVLASGGQP